MGERRVSKMGIWLLQKKEMVREGLWRVLMMSYDTKTVALS